MKNFGSLVKLLGKEGCSQSGCTAEYNLQNTLTGGFLQRDKHLMDQILIMFFVFNMKVQVERGLAFFVLDAKLDNVLRVDVDTAICI